MRKIKFKVLFKDIKERATFDSNMFMISSEGDIVMNPKGSFIIIPQSYEVVQFIGLYDKNNKEIYNKYLLKVMVDKVIKLGCIKETLEGWVIVVLNDDMKWGHLRDASCYAKDKLEIIGNLVEDSNMQVVIQKEKIIIGKEEVKEEKKQEEIDIRSKNNEHPEVKLNDILQP